MPAQMAGPGRNHIWFTEVALDVIEPDFRTATQHPDTYWTEGPAIYAETPEEALQYVRCNIRAWPWPLGNSSELGYVTNVRLYQARLGSRIFLEREAS